MHVTKGYEVWDDVAHKEVDNTTRKLKILDKSIEALKKRGDRITSYMLAVCNKLN